MFIFSAVTGNANYCMERTALTVGGFTQPNVAKAIIDNSSSVEKGLTQRFLWLFPKPSFAKFETLEMIDEQFSEYLGKVLTSVHQILVFVAASIYTCRHAQLYIIIYIIYNTFEGNTCIQLNGWLQSGGVVRKRSCCYHCLMIAQSSRSITMMFSKK